VGRFDGARAGDGFERNPGFNEVRKQSREQESALLYSWGVEKAISPLSHGFQRLPQSFAPAIHAELFRLSSGIGPLGRWAGLCAESRSRETEEKGQSPQRPPAVYTPLAVDCGSCVVPFLAGYPPSFPNHPSGAKSHHEHDTIRIAP